MCSYFFAYNLVIALPLILCPAYHIFSITYWVPTISVLNLAIFPCYSNLLLRNWRRFGILWWGVLGERLPPIDCLWSYGVFPLLHLRECSLLSFVRHYSCSKYFILRHWLFCLHFLYGICVNLIPVHTYYERFWLKNRVWQLFTVLRCQSFSWKVVGAWTEPLTSSETQHVETLAFDLDKKVSKYLLPSNWFTFDFLPS
jgi:hypothetical protein